MYIISDKLLKQGPATYRHVPTKLKMPMGWTNKGPLPAFEQNHRCKFCGKVWSPFLRYEDCPVRMKQLLDVKNGTD